MDTKKLRQKILDLAIRGKLVPQDPNDEPASVLLERIRAEKERLIKEGKIKRSKKTASDDEIEAPFEIPESWEWTTIEEICSKIGSGSTPKGSNYSLSGIPFFRSQNVYNEGLIYDDIKYISEEVHHSMKGTEVIKNDLLLNITGGSLGRCAIVPDNFERGNVSQHVCILRPIIFLPSFLHAFIISDYFSSTMILSGSGREGLPKYSLEVMSLPLPPLAEQKRIVTEIERWFTLIDELESNEGDLLKAIDKAKSKILDLAIHGKLVPQDPNDEPAIELLKRINPKFEPCDNIHNPYIIPERWEWTSLGMIGKWQSGGTPDRNNKHYYNGDIPWLKIADLQDSFINETTEWITQEGLENSSAKYNPTGSVALAMYGSIGKVGILTFPATTNQAICVCSEYIIAQKFLFFYLISQRDNFYLLSGGGVQANISKQIIVKHPVPIPPMEEQLRIVAKIEELFAVLDSIKESLE